MTEQEILKYNYTNDGRNYVLLGNTRWIAFTRNVIENKLIPKFGRNFNLVVYWHNNSSDETDELPFKEEDEDTNDDDVVDVGEEEDEKPVVKKKKTTLGLKSYKSLKTSLKNKLKRNV